MDMMVKKQTSKNIADTTFKDPTLDVMTISVDLELTKLKSIDIETFFLILETDASKQIFKARLRSASIIKAIKKARAEQLSPNQPMPTACENGCNQGFNNGSCKKYCHGKSNFPFSYFSVSITCWLLFNLYNFFQTLKPCRLN